MNTKKKVVKKKAPIKKRSASVKKKVVKKKVAPKKTLTRRVVADERYQAFALEYVKHFNGTQSAIAVGYSEKSAASQGSRLLSHAKVQGYIAEALKERAETTKIDAEWLLTRLAAEATADVADLYHKDGGLKPVHEWPEIWRQGLVAGFDVEQKFMYVDGESEPDGLITKIKLSDRTKRLEMIGKHVDVQAWLNKVEVNDNTTLADRLRRSRDRAQGKRGASS